MKIEHKLSPVKAQHCAEVLTQIRGNALKVLQLKGQIRDLDQDTEQMGKHLSVLIGLVEKDEMLPPSKTPYTLAQDGLSLLGETDDPKPEVA